MATSTKIKKDWLKLYDDFPTQDVGIGTIDPDIFATPGYQKKKIQKIFIGGLNKIIYAGFENDPQPLLLALAFEPQYNTIIGYNLHYLPVVHRDAIIKFIFKSNVARIKKKLPLLVDFRRLQRLVPKSAGALRRYKIQGIRVKEVVPLVGWGVVVKEKSKFSGHYRENL